MRVLAKMELSGIALDEKWLAQESIDLENDLKNLETKIFELSEEEFNMNSPRQLGEILFEKLKLDPKAKKNKNRTIRHFGRYSSETFFKARNHQVYFGIQNLSKTEIHLRRCASVPD